MKSKDMTMRVVGLETENFKRLKAINIRPADHMNTIIGKNGAGKSSVLDAIWVALEGLRVAPPEPIRKGAEKCRIRLDMGEMIVTRTFGRTEEGKPTDTLKLEDPEGRRYSKPQTVLDELLGAIGFDPFEFVQMKPEKQAATLLEMVPLSVDLDELFEADEKDFAARRDINRDAAALKARLDAIDVPAELPEAIDREALTTALAEAADVNSAIERDRLRRSEMGAEVARQLATGQQDRGRAEEIRREIARLESMATAKDKDAAEMDRLAEEGMAKIKALPPLGDLVDTAALREKISAAERVEVILGRAATHKTLSGQLAELTGKSDALTLAMRDRGVTRKEALGKAKMPIEGLSIETAGKTAMVYYGGVPFEQASTAEQLKVSTAIAMAANPTLRVLRIKDGSLLDDDSMALLDQLARAEDFQLWIERVGTGGVGIVIVDGEIADEAKPEPEAEQKPKAEPKAKAADPDKLL
jgi:DNA repair exonuclease SbcCD ATPase subunit